MIAMKPEQLLSWKQVRSCSVFFKTRWNGVGWRGLNPKQFTLGFNPPSFHPIPPDFKANRTGPKPKCFCESYAFNNSGYALLADFTKIISSLFFHCMAWIDFNIDQSRQTLGHSSPCNFEGDSKVICCLLATVACKAQWWQMLVQGLTPQLFYKTTTRIRGYFLFLSYDVIFFLWIYFKLMPAIGASHLHVFHILLIYILVLDQT